MPEISLKNRLLTGGAWAFAGKVLASLSGLAVNALIARLLSPQEMGAYFLTLSLVSVASIVAQFGLTKTIVRLVAESMGTGRPARARQAVWWTIRITGIGASTIAGVLAFGGGQWIARHIFHSNLMVQVMGLAALWVVVLTFQNLIAEVFRGFHDIRLATIFGGLSTSILSMLMFSGLWIVMGHGNLNQVIALALAAATSSIALSALLLGKRLSVLPAHPCAIAIKDILAITWPLWITSLTLFILTQADLWILGIFRSQAEVAIYGAAARLVALVAMPLLIVNAVVPPIISEMYPQGKTREMERVLRTTATIAGLPALVVLAVFIFWGADVLKLVFGEYYRGGGIMLAILSVGQLANAWAGSCGLTLMLTGHQFTMMAITIFCGTLVMLSSWVLVAHYGSLGVAAAAATGMVMQNVLMLLFAKRKVGIWTHMRPSLIKNAWSVL